MTFVEFQTESNANPVDMVEQIASANDWTHERAGEHEIAISIAGSWTDYHISFTWMDDIEALHLACAFDMRVPDRGGPRSSNWSRGSTSSSGSAISTIGRRKGQSCSAMLCPLAGTNATPEQCQTLLEAAVETAERYFQSFQFVVWAGRSAQEALEEALFETVGHA